MTLRGIFQSLNNCMLGIKERAINSMRWHILIFLQNNIQRKRRLFFWPYITLCKVITSSLYLCPMIMVSRFSVRSLLVMSPPHFNFVCFYNPGPGLLPSGLGASLVLGQTVGTISHCEECRLRQDWKHSLLSNWSADFFLALLLVDNAWCRNTRNASLMIFTISRE